MYDSWLEAIDSGNIVGVALCNMSAAFNVVDTKLLLDTCSWIWQKYNTMDVELPHQQVTTGIHIREFVLNMQTRGWYSTRKSMKAKYIL